MKNFKLNEQEMIQFMSYVLRMKNRLIGDLEDGKKNNYHEEFINYYQKEVDEINNFEDSINSKFKTNFN